ncbi:glycerate kinase [Marinococcus halophilus]|uniref:Glycerate kinase n=1 Tax=Marinococcus halophilus TaxID=1371 RepID=A0A510Y2L1_MARHA|nr:glycerate kinase [Marinococcus halophilus]OZT81584.1 glycerate kinase [Marinococcus halophilus]GEK57529.1 glycerate kinase [Marinococcus halophilus]
MKVVIAPDSFKESMTAMEAAQAIERGFRQGMGNPGALVTELIPMADGGEGTTQSLRDGLGGEVHAVDVSGPDGSAVKAEFVYIQKSRTAVIEMAEASGIGLVTKKNREPLTASSYGTGQMILKALYEGAERIILGLGGSATNDGGAGMAAALGVRFLDQNGEDIAPGGAALKHLHRIDVSGIDKRIHEVTVRAACDVTNPLTGPEGASAVYGPQKGAEPEDVQELDEALRMFGEVIERDLHKPVLQEKGAGAAGGLGAGAIAFLNAALEPGIDIVLEESRFSERSAGASLVITGEGKIDAQTVFGKTPVGVAKASPPGSTVVAVAGQLGDGYEKVYEAGIDAAFSMVPGIVSLDQAMEESILYMENWARSLGGLWKTKA